MNRNIALGYVLNFIMHSWLWLGIWVFYYLRFTTYAGIGLIESVMISVKTIMEVPTGAIADLLGKKITIVLAFFLSAVGTLTMGFAQNIFHLLLATATGAVAGALYSGSFEALIYDTLKEQNKESIFDRIISQIFSLQLISLALSSVIGGYLYLINPRLPFFVLGILTIFGCFIALFLQEPSIDTEKFNLRSFLRQNKLGIKELFKTSALKQLTIYLLAVGCIMVVGDEVLNDILALEFGFEPMSLSFLSAAAFVVAGSASFLTPYLRKHYSDKAVLIFLSTLIGISFFVSPVAGLILGGITYVSRYSLEAILYGTTSTVLNNKIDSKYRATALSAFNMLKSLPYVLMAYFLGYLMDLYSARSFAFVLGVIMLIIVTIYFLVFKYGNKRTY